LANGDFARTLDVSGLREADVRTIGIARAVAAVAVAGTALVAVGASTAHAAAHPRAMFTPRGLAATAPRAGLLRGLAQQLPGAAGPSLASLELFTDPVALSVDGVAYQMSLDAQNLPAAFDMPPELSVELDRTASAGGRVTGEQYHVYSYAPIGGLHLTAGSSLTHATLRTGSSMKPTAITLRFHAVGTVERLPCTLIGGGSGTFQIASGKITARRFKVDTGTSPFFGTITAAPRTATVVSDPGCGAVSFSATLRPAHLAQCGSRETIEHSSLTSFWESDLGFRGGRVTQIGVTESNPFGPAGVSHLAAGIGPGADMPHPVRMVGGGVRAAIRTAGVPFMGGSAVFRSSGRPSVTRGHSCAWEGHVHRFTTTRYSGTLTPAGPPLATLFDTGSWAVAPTRATLVVRAFAG
jgi:hypothetical protein